MTDNIEKLVYAARLAAIEHNVGVITTPPVGDHWYGQLIDVREVERRVRAGEPLKEMMK